MIDLKTLRDLIKLMAANDLTELELADPAGEKVTLKRGRGDAPQVQYVPAPAAVPAPTAPATAAAPAKGGADAGESIRSPMVGTFYAAASPDAKPFVSVGDSVNAETVVCVIEAMKVFNEIKAEAAGTITKVLVANGQAVEFGQPLFLIKPN